ncbi:MAG TPA: XdhC family protein [Acidobacteriaceae bacterium]|nr:XdhC family protein [Acidobacteriaceae bacterium]
MVERNAIVEQWRNRQDDTGVLATLVRVEGSSYRRPGARMYIHASGSVGAISGGCLEGEVSRKAAWIARNGAAVERYSTLFDEILDDANSLDAREIPYGLGCGGVMDVLLEQVASPETSAMLQALEAAERGETLYAATVLPSAADQTLKFARVILREDQTVFFASADLDAEMASKLKRLASAGGETNTVSIVLANAIVEVFVEPVLPPQRLVLFGAGDDARPLVRMANLLGWRVTVADGRSWLAQAARFPEAERVLTLSENAANFEQLALSHRDAVALLTHSFEQDRNLLGILLPLDLRYLGLLGARHRSRLLLTEAASHLGWSPEEALQRVHAPIGLDLGGDSPEAVALAILAEIQAVLRQKTVISRGMSTEDFLNAPDRPYIPVQCSLDSLRQTREPSDTVHAVETAR